LISCSRDAESFNGKVVGGVAAWAAASDVPVLAVVGDYETDIVIPDNIEVVSLVQRFGLEAAYERTLDLVADVVCEHLA
jgi:glycerate 2-kinase